MLNPQHSFRIAYNQYIWKYKESIFDYVHSLEQSNFFTKKKNNFSVENDVLDILHSYSNIIMSCSLYRPNNKKELTMNWCIYNVASYYWNFLEQFQNVKGNENDKGESHVQLKIVPSSNFFLKHCFVLYDVQN